MDASKTRYNGRAYGMDIRVEFRLVKRGSADEIISHYDVSGSMRKFFGRY